MTTFIKKIQTIIFGKKALQSFYMLLYKISLKGMNFGFSEASDSGEKYVLERTKQKFSDKAVIFDVGGNQGQYSLLSGEVFGENANIYSFEPGKWTFSEHAKNTKNLKNIKRNNFGLGSENKEEVLHYDKEGSGLASVFKRDLAHADIDFSKEEKIKIKTLDSFCIENNIDHIDLLKIDVEGYELEVLKGAQKMLADKKIHSIQFEFGGCNIDSRTYFHDFYTLLKDNYTLYRILQDGIYEIKAYSELQEIFTTVNYFAELK